MSLNKLLGPEIQELIKTKDFSSLKVTISDWEAPEIAELLMMLPEEDQPILFRLLPKKMAAEVFSYLDPDAQEDLLLGLKGESIRNILEELDPDDRTALFEELPAEVTSKLLNLLPPDERKEALSLLGYPEDSVGRLMTPDYVKVKSHWTSERAIEHVRNYGTQAETIDILYVVDREGKLIGEVKLSDLVLASPEERIENIMDTHIHALSAYQDQEEAAKVMQLYDRIALPVVDSEGKLIGIVTFDDIMDVVEEETTEDIQKIASVEPLQIDYSRAGPGILYRKRVIWLVALLIASFLSSAVIQHFSYILQSVIVLAIFIPVINGSGGNTGTQSSTLIIRALATGDITLRDWVRIVGKEILVGMLLGSTLGVFLFLRSYLGGYGIEISLVIGLAIFFVVIWANIIGAILPIVISTMRLDPAVVSSPLLSTLVDWTGLFIYFSIAKIILNI